MIEKVIKDRMEVVGLTQHRLAQSIGCTPTQLSLFLKGEASLNRNSLNQCFKVLGIKLNSISKRIELAREVAGCLNECSVNEVINMSRHDMIVLTKIKEIAALPEVNKEEFEIMVSSDLGDYESTFQYFKTLVLHYMDSPEGFTPKKAEQSLNVLASLLVATPFVPILGIGSIIGAAVSSFAISNSKVSNAINNTWGPLTTLAMNLFNKNEK